MKHADFILFGRLIFLHLSFPEISENIVVKEIPFNSLPNDKILGWWKLKAFADDKLNVT